MKHCGIYSKKKTDLKESDLLEAVTHVDLKDGRFDGKNKQPTTIQCKQCHRNNSKRHSQCIYCGDVLLVGPFE